jgi:hypothetical protein
VEVTSWPSRIDPLGNTVISDSDAHFLDDIGSRSFTFEAPAPTFAGLKAALAAGRVQSSLMR